MKGYSATWNPGGDLLADTESSGSGIYGMDSVYGLDEPHFAWGTLNSVSWTVKLHPQLWYIQR